jgi:lipopolysaccharide/colanic/teichoic acid biosynthesis glycosyltransferase
MTAALTSGKRLHCIPDGSDLLSLSPIEEQIGEFLSLTYLPFEVQRIHLLFKRVMDLLLTILLLALLAIPMLVLLIFIPIGSSGGPIYTQQRV